MSTRRALTIFTLAFLVLTSPLLAQPHRPNPPVRTASAASPLSILRDLAAAFWARVAGIWEKGGSGLDPNGLTGNPTPPDGSDSGSGLNPDGRT
jgi:hypothetical protein